MAQKVNQVNLLDIFIKYMEQLTFACIGGPMPLPDKIQTDAMNHGRLFGMAYSPPQFRIIARAVSIRMCIYCTQDLSDLSTYHT